MTRRPHRLVLAGVLLFALALTGCAGDASSTADGGSTSQGADAPGDAPPDAPAVRTPTDLAHPCDVVTGAVASRLLGTKVTTKKVANQMTGRSLDCSYVPAKQTVDAPFLELVTAPDPTPLPAMVGLYLGVDRLRHHPVEVPGASAAEVIFDPAVALTVTLFAKQGYVTHTVVLGIDEEERAERVAVRAAALLVAGNPTD